MRRPIRIGREARHHSGRRLRLESLEPRTFLAADAAGETFATAAELGVINGTVERQGNLGGIDRADVIRFSVSDESAVRIRLDPLDRNADLYVLDRSGNLIGSSKQSGTRPDTLVGSLRSGEYFIGIAATSSRNNRYRITVTANPVTTPPIAPPPIAPPPVAPPPVATPQVPGPLDEVAYFGGGNDWNVNAVAAPESWAAGYRGQGVTVAVVDTGIDLDHPDLRGSLYVNPGEIAGNGIDDDHNGYIDDRTGYDFVSADSRPDDGNGHGTHVAGIIAAANNGVGSTGIAPGAKILPVRVLNDSGSGSDQGVAAGIRYAADLGAQIINLSLGGDYSARIADAIRYATTLGSLVIAAAGNESAGTPSNPASQSALSSGILSVGAYDSAGRIASFSNRVGDSGAVQIDAPGVGIYSTYLDGGYRMLSGTSMASPHVAGIAALLLSANQSLTAAELRGLLAAGTVGKASQSDSIGKVSAMHTVAAAAAGLRSQASTIAALASSVPSETSGNASNIRAAQLEFSAAITGGDQLRWNRSDDAGLTRAVAFAGAEDTSPRKTMSRPRREATASTETPTDRLFAEWISSEHGPAGSDCRSSRGSIDASDAWFAWIPDQAWCWHDELAFG